MKRNTATYEIAGSWTLAEGKALFLADMAQEQAATSATAQDRSTQAHTAGHSPELTQ